MYEEVVEKSDSNKIWEKNNQYVLQVEERQIRQWFRNSQCLQFAGVNFLDPHLRPLCVYLTTGVCNYLVNIVNRSVRLCLFIIISVLCRYTL